MQDLDVLDRSEVDRAEQAARELVQRVDASTRDAITTDPAAQKLQQEIARLLVASLDKMKATLSNFDVLLVRYQERGKDPAAAYLLLPQINEMRDATEVSLERLAEAAKAFEGTNLDLYRVGLVAYGKLLAAIKSVLEACERSAEKLNRADRRRLDKTRRAVSHMPKVPLTDPPPKPKR